MNTKTQLGNVTTTERGFALIEFKDHYNGPCSLQASSLADYEKPGTSAVWLGRDEVTPMVLASKAESVGVKTDQTTGWVEYPLPEGVQLVGRMHLNREQVAALVGHLQEWLENDSF